MAQDTKPGYGRVLLHWGLPLRVEQTYRGDHTSLERSALPSIIEELVASSAVGIAVPSSSNASAVVSEMPRIFKERAVILDDTIALQQTSVILSPVAAQFGIKLTQAHGLGLGHETPAGVGEAVAELSGGLAALLLGMQHKLQIDLDVLRLRRRATELRALSRDPAARGLLASLEGVLNVYESIGVPGLRFTPNPPEGLVSSFRDLVEDEVYRQMSAAAGGLGVPERLGRTLKLLERHARKVALKPAFRQIVTPGVRAALAAQGIPVPSADVFTPLLEPGYLPPVVPIRTAVERVVGVLSAKYPHKRYTWTHRAWPWGT